MTAINFSPSPRREIADKILAVAGGLFEAVKSAPLSARVKFPKVLQKNNFALALRVTSTHAFLEVTTKLQAQRSRETARVNAYRQIFTSTDSGEASIFKIDKVKLVRISGATLEAPHAFAIGKDFSMCAWDIRSTANVGGRILSHDLDVIYVVGFGSSIREEDAWQELDALIRVTIADWSGIR